jgi:cellulose synthase/poly-beta-1,6-N-acetylglucosamine synthase-like glycosyltransferase
MGGIGLYILGATSFAVSVYSLLSSIAYSRYLRRAGTRDPALSNGHPSVTLFIPCCGAEEGLEENLRALFHQDYPKLELVFIVEKASDAALPVIRNLTESKMRPSRLIVAGRARACSQKIHNLKAGLAQMGNAEILAFADSDIRPPPHWLTCLVTTLERNRVGVATSYRFYVPEPGNFATLLRSAWNAGVLTILGDHDHNFAWGGSMALRTEVFREAGVESAWQGALSDDYALTHAVRKAGYKVEFVPHAIVPSFGRTHLAEVLNWCHRQMSITRVYWRNLWRIAGGSQILFTAFLVAAALACLAGDALVGLILAFVLAGSAGSGVIRTRALGSMGPDWRKRLQPHCWAYVVLIPCVSLLTTYGFIRSALSRRIEWRGKTYEMRSPTETTLLDEHPTQR